MGNRADRPGNPAADRKPAAPSAPQADSAHRDRLAEALALHERGALAPAVALYQALLAAEPQDARLWLNLGAALHGLGRRGEALSAYGEATTRDPGLVEAVFNRGCLLTELGRDEEAALQFAAALKLQPSFAAAQYNLANTQRRLGLTDAAVAAYRAAIALRPSHADSWNGLGLALRELGAIADAEAAFRRALECKPDHGAAFANLATVHRFRAGDPLLAQVRDIDARRIGMPPRARAEIAYALGKIYDDLDDPAIAMARLAEGAALLRAEARYDEAGELALIAGILNAVTPEVLARPPAGCPSPMPVFVVGMPRSGTTLVEQILASHPAVIGAGELKALGRCLEGWIGPTGVDLTAGGSARERGEAYLRAIEPLIGAQTARVVDKMPDNFRYVGLIHLILPNATIVHCRRDPLDTCLSCYRTRFAEGNAWSYDLTTLGRRYRAYAETMSRWEALLPERVFELRYEALVEQPEREIRRLLAHCGLDFDPACLAFHRQRGRVATASAAQVRQPIHTGSVGRAERYRPYLQPLLNALSAPVF